MAKTTSASAVSTSTKPKREKSGKKRKTDAVTEAPPQPLSTEDAKSTAIQESTVPSEAPESPTTAAPASTKPKKNKLSKKRKAEALTENEPQDIIAESPSSAALPESNLVSATSPNVISPGAEDSEKPPSKKRKTVVEEIEVDITAPEPPSKKALRRLKKGKPLPPSKSGAESSPEPETKPTKKSEVEKRSEHGIWIGNLPWHVSKTELRTFFVDNSDITEEVITRIHMPGPNDSKPANKVEERKFAKVQHNKGFAYVDFSSADAVGKAVELSEQLLVGRRVLIKDNKSFEGRPEKTKEESRKDGKPPSRRVFFGNLAFDTTEESLKQYFEKCGPITSVKVATFEDSGKCKGYAWIVFDELEAAENAVRGFVRIEEEDSDISESGNESDAGSDVGFSKPKPKKTKLRKWWVNKIKGRTVRSEFAEDAQVRYKKRYGKDGTKNNAATEASGPVVREIKESEKVVEYHRSYAPRLTGGIVESKGKKVTF
jgi:RNA recognition motif-containing protein